MDRFGNADGTSLKERRQSSKKQKFATLGEVAGLIPPPPIKCEICGPTSRRVFKDKGAVDCHIKAIHYYQAFKVVYENGNTLPVSKQVGGSDYERMESALIKIVNAMTLEEAIEIATEALL